MPTNTNGGVLYTLRSNIADENWDAFKSAVKAKWTTVTDDDIKVGKFDEMVDKSDKNDYVAIYNTGATSRQTLEYEGGGEPVVLDYRVTLTFDDDTTLDVTSSTNKGLILKGGSGTQADPYKLDLDGTWGDNYSSFTSKGTAETIKVIDLKDSWVQFGEMINIDGLVGNSFIVPFM